MYIHIGSVKQRERLVISAEHIESDISNIDIFCKYGYRIEAGEKISIFRYFHMIAQKDHKQKHIHKKKTYKKVGL